ncbi:phage terminase large subunit [Microvirga yunnanensis]|uniref:phage terminase large subunit n=1 Tax=Microvirga yunnanensis TaxID=2953740 RepID=UPI0021C83B7B|nr:phage terminase large subunit [Microvirga sp. HBU65207]
MTDRARLLRALLRQDLSVFSQKVFATLEPGTAYQHNWHIDHLCWQLTRVARGELRRLIINVPPRSMKSITVSVGFTAWVLGRDPTRRIICASYADDLARKLSVDTRTVIDSPWYRELFPQMRLASKRPRNTELVTTQQGYRYAAGMSGSILGRGADLIVIDDPIKATDALSEKERRRVTEAFDNTLYTRLNDKRTGAIVIIMQRLHQDDLVGHVLAKGDWEVVSIPAIETEERAYQLSNDPEDIYIRRAGEVLHAAREPRDILEQMRRSQGSLTFSAQYQQAPVPPEGNIVKREWLRTYAARPSSFDMVIASWDTASTLSETSDYSVGTVWGAKGLDFYLLDLVRGRFEVPELRREVLRLSQTWSADQTIIEDTDIGRAITQDLRRSGEWRAILRRPRFDKEARFLAQSARFESGQVHVPPDASWLAGWLDELLAFPNGRHDDQVDSTSQALDYLTARTHPLQVSEIPRERPQRVQRPAGFRRPTGFGRI